MKPRLDYNSLSHLPGNPVHPTSQHLPCYIDFIFCLFVSICVSPIGLKAPSENQYSKSSAVASSCFSLNRSDVCHLSGSLSLIISHLHLVHPFFFFTYHFFRYFLVYLSVYLELVSPLEYGPQELRLFLPYSSLYLHCLEKCLDIEGL